MDRLQPSRPHPAPDHPAWGPPSTPPVTARPRAGSTPQPPVARTTKRRHPAAKARRAAGWAAVASSAAIVGYMVTANADSGATQSITPSTPKAAPTVAAPAAGNRSDDDAPQVVLPATPATVPLPSRNQPSARPAQFPGGGQPISSSHGS
jgi:hypothetical protein